MYELINSFFISILREAYMPRVTFRTNAYWQYRPPILIELAFIFKFMNFEIFLNQLKTNKIFTTLTSKIDFQSIPF